MSAHRNGGTTTSRTPLPRPSSATPPPARPVPSVAPVLDELAEVYAGLVLGVRGYVRKDGLEKVCLGVSGGIDSALVLLAVDALGAGHVEALLMPSRYNSAETRADARRRADNLGVRSHEISIFWFAGFPVPLRGGTGAPVRAVAFPRTGS
ncbi:hypothetical protein ACGF5O_41450 [Streptomyces sp. NPDC048291]|uniref:hypothetical protein n=1 Tax=Streptomyces sp. NPDC048291 TaxID=3365530 RepID=UPI003719E0B0